MAFEQNNNSGALFENERKETDRHPDMTGTVKVGEVEYYISAWERESRSGKPYLSLSFTEKNQSGATTRGTITGRGFGRNSRPQRSQGQNYNNDDNYDEDVPF
jgi:hypothetical protein